MVTRRTPNRKRVAGAAASTVALAGALTAAMPPGEAAAHDERELHPSVLIGHGARSVVRIQWGDGTFCSGFLYDNDTVATAGHCVFKNGQWKSAWGDGTVIPGLEPGAKPYGYCKTGSLYSVSGWTQSSNPGYDYGAIKLHSCTGSYHWDYGFDSSLLFYKPRHRNYGYACAYTAGCDKMYYSTGPGDGPIGPVIPDRLRRFDMKTSFGMSGGPVRDLDGGYVASGIISGEVCTATCGTLSPILLPTEAIQRFNDWR